MSNQLTRDEMMGSLRNLMGEHYFIQRSERFGERPGGIWASGESWSETLRVRPFDFYSDDRYRAYHPVEEFIANSGWWWQWHDAGTVLMFPMRARRVHPAAVTVEAACR